MKMGIISKSISNILGGNLTEGKDVIMSRSLSMPFCEGGCNACGECVRICPTNAIGLDGGWSIDIGRCIFCMECVRSCDSIGLVDAPVAVRRRGDLIFKEGESMQRADALFDSDVRRAIGKSISIREVDTGSCNACEAEVNMMSSPYMDFERFGMRIVASPRHADVLLVTGPVTENMRDAFLNAIASTPSPKVIVAMGTCAISGGIFSKGNVIGEGILGTCSVDLYIPGCPPSSDMLVKALLMALKKDV